MHGPIEFDDANIEDFVILRSDGHPTYHLSVVSDDVEMGITHVVRGDDHISNTPKQILLYQAVGAPVPTFAHVPLILGPDKKRLSKRHGATSVMEYARQGYLPEAMVNFLALLGWSPGTDQELFTRDELVAAFALEGISGGNAVFNPEKLDWFNQQYIVRLAPDELARRVRPSFEAAGLWSDDLARRSRTRGSSRPRAAEAAREAARRFRRAGRVSSSATRSSTTRRPSRSTCAREGMAAPSRGARRRVRRAARVRRGVDRGGAARGGRGARREGGRAHSRRARGADREDGQSRGSSRCSALVGRDADASAAPGGDRARALVPA